MWSGNELSGYSTPSLQCAKISKTAAHALESSHDIMLTQNHLWAERPHCCLHRGGPILRFPLCRTEEIDIKNHLFTSSLFHYWWEQKLTPTRTLFREGLYITPQKYIKDKLSLRSWRLHWPAQGWKAAAIRCHGHRSTGSSERLPLL